MEKIEKLPKWAQQEIVRLRSNIESLEREMRQRKGEEETNTFLLHRAMEKDEHLPKDSEILFINKNRSQITVRLEKEALYINAYNRIKVIPNASNTVSIEFDR